MNKLLVGFEAIPFLWESEAIPVNILTSTLPNQFITGRVKAGEAPAEPKRCLARQEPRPPVRFQFIRHCKDVWRGGLALPLFFNRARFAKILQGASRSR